MDKIFKLVLVTCLMALLTACIGDDSDDDQQDSAPPAPEPVEFSVELVDINVVRVATEESVDVDTEQVASGELVLQ